MFIIGTDTFLISPLLTTLSSLYHIDTSISGWMVSAYTIGYALFALVSGPISDGRDRKKVMVYGWVAFTISTFLCGFANSFALMFLFRFLAGISASFVTSQVWASIPVVVEKKNIVQVMGYATAVYLFLRWQVFRLVVTLLEFHGIPHSLPFQRLPWFYCFLLIFICQNWKLERVIKSPLQVLIKMF